jgi:trehalose 6-phosphate phosphatase
LSDTLPRITPDSALFLDVDGTLLDIAARPDAARVPSGLREDLAVLSHRLGGALALVSGRSIASVDRLFKPLLLPVAGQHGAELRRAPGVRVQRTAQDVDFEELRVPLERFAAAWPGILIEWKGRSVAVHCLAAPGSRGELGAVLAAEVEKIDGIELMDSRSGFDLKPRAVSKGSAIEWFLGEPPFRGRLPVFAGDDVTDEGGFAAVLQHQGFAIRVGSEGKSLARLRVANPADFRAWLSHSVHALATREMGEAR